VDDVSLGVLTGIKRNHEALQPEVDDLLDGLFSALWIPPVAADTDGVEAAPAIGTELGHVLVVRAVHEFLHFLVWIADKSHQALRVDDLLIDTLIVQVLVADVKLKAIVEDRASQRGVDVGAFRIRLHRIWEPNTPVPIEPHTGSGVATFRWETLVEDVLGQLDVVVRRNQDEIRRQLRAVTRLANAVDNHPRVRCERVFKGQAFIEHGVLSVEFFSGPRSELQSLCTTEPLTQMSTHVVMLATRVQKCNVVALIAQCGKGPTPVALVRCVQMERIALLPSRAGHSPRSGLRRGACQRSPRPIAPRPSRW